MASKPKDRRQRRTDPHRLARVTLSEILGLLEAIDEAGGESTAAAVGQDVEEDVSRLGPILDATEFLGLLTVDEGTLRITDLSRRILHAGVRERKAIFRSIVQDLPLFRLLLEKLRSVGRPLSRDEVVQAIGAAAGSHRAEDLVDALVFWGRYVELLRYDGNSEQLSLRTPAKA